MFGIGPDILSGWVPGVGKKGWVGWDLKDLEGTLAYEEKDAPANQINIYLFGSNGSRAGWNCASSI